MLRFLQPLRCLSTVAASRAQQHTATVAFGDGIGPEVGGKEFRAFEMRFCGGENSAAH